MGPHPLLPDARSSGSTGTGSRGRCDALIPQCPAPGPERLLQSIQHKVCPHRTCYSPPYNATGKHVNHKSDIHKPGPRRHISKIRHPKLIWARSSKLPLHQIPRTVHRPVRYRRPAGSPPNYPPEPHCPHQSLLRTPGYRYVLPVELKPHLPGSVHLETLRADSPDLLRKLPVPPHPDRLPRWVSLPSLMFVVRRWGDRQFSADRLDPILRPVFIDKRRHYLRPRSNSAWAKKADALRNISLARFSSRFSRSNALRRSRSVLVRPPRIPWSISDRRTYIRKVSAVQPILPAIDSIADHCELCSFCCSNTIRTARSRTSGEYFVVFFMTLSSQIVEPPVNPGGFTEPGDQKADGWCWDFPQPRGHYPTGRRGADGTERRVVGLQALYDA
ncbi:MAG: hypothetical protein FD164_698, partial [Nitrospirae bacterium]